MTFRCPRCGRPLTERKTARGLLWHCDQCDGRAATIPVLRRQAPQEAVSRLWQEARGAGRVHSHACPACGNPMVEVRAPAPEGQAETLDVCPLCGLVWLDAGEWSHAPEPPPPNRAPAASSRRRHSPSPSDAIAVGAEPNEWWQWIPGLLGLPIEVDSPPRRRFPLVTWGVALLLVAVAILTFPHLESWVRAWGLIPADPGRNGGWTFLTAFFLHGGLFHLLSNLYFLLLFGDNVEDALGSGLYALLLLTATLAGNWLHLAADPRSTIPLIGASGGISGVVAFYALAYPQARLALLWRFFFLFEWIQIPAWSMFLFWLLTQLLMAVLQIQGATSVSAFAHLGGAAVGVLFWFAFASGQRPTDA